jgi:hypothetical protein
MHLVCCIATLAAASTVASILHSAAVITSATSTCFHTRFICARLLLHVVVVGAGQQVAEDELRHVHSLLLMHLHRNAVAVVPHLDGVGLLQDEQVQETVTG